MDAVTPALPVRLQHTLCLALAQRTRVHMAMVAGGQAVHLRRQGCQGLLRLLLRQGVGMVVQGVLALQMATGQPVLIGWVYTYLPQIMQIFLYTMGLMVLLLVWVADIFAYFAGRAFGLRLTKGKLAPSISPGKSWEGVWGGMVGVLLMAGVWIWIDTQYAVDSPSLFTRLYSRGAPFLVLATVFLTLMSVAGDLVESLVKRSAGIKDSSQLLPGHGGVLDRVDALLPTLPLALMLAQSV